MSDNTHLPTPDKNHSRKINFFLCAILSAALLAGGCAKVTIPGNSTASESESTSSVTEPATESAIDTTPAFLAAAEPVAGSENLSEIHTDFLADGDYSAALALGSNLLLIRMYVPESAYTDIGSDGDYEEDYAENFCYQFDLYSLEENAITASLNTEEASGDYYMIVGDQLYLMDYTNSILRRYDANLSSLGTYDATELMNSTDCFLYASSEEDSCYAVNYDDKSIIQITFSEDTYTLSECATDYYCSYISMSSTDSSKLLLDAVDTETFRSGIRIVDTENLSTMSSYIADSYYYTIISDDALLAQVSTGTEPYFCDWFDGASVYFAAPSGYSFSLMGEYVSATQDSLYDYENDNPAYSARVYNNAGICTSAMSYGGDRDGDGETDIYIPSDPVYFEEYDCVLILTCDVEEGGYLLLWDLTSAGEDADNLMFYNTAEVVPESASTDSSTETGDTEVENPEADGTTVTRIPDRDSYDWGDFTDLRSRADALEETYGISIYLGPEVPSRIGTIYDTAQCLDVDVLTEAMDMLEQILTLYPENFFTQLIYDDMQGIRIYLAGTLSGTTEGMVADPSGYVEDVNRCLVMVLDTNQSWDWDYTVNHEISHMVDRALEYRSNYQENALYSEETWSTYNPDGFEYLYTYDGYEYNLDYDTWSDYFIDYYGTTFPTEDRAEIFGRVMFDYIYDGLYEYTFTENDGILQKLDYYCACIRDGFDTTGWDEVMPWEKYTS